MSLQFLRENHTFKVGDFVTVTNRYNTNEKHDGRIYSIVSLPINRGVPDEHTNHFYISFPNKNYDTILMKGLEVIHNGKPTVLGEVERDSSGKIIKLYEQNIFTGESEINIYDIYAPLISRAAYKISKVSP